MGQRTVPIILMIVYEIIFRPFLLSTKFQFPHLINLQRLLVIELAVAHFEPAGIGINYGIVNGPGGLRDSSYLLSGVCCHGGGSCCGLAGGVDGLGGVENVDQGCLRKWRHLTIGERNRGLFMKTSGIVAALPAQKLGRTKTFYNERVGLQAAE